MMLFFVLIYAMFKEPVTQREHTHTHMRGYLCVPLWVDGVPGHSGALLLAMVWQ